MRPLFGPRTVVEAAFLVAVPVIALEVGLGWLTIVGAGAVAYLVVLAVEGLVWGKGRRAAPAVAAEAVPAHEEPQQQQQHVRVIRTEEPVAEPVEVAAAPAPEPVRLAPAPEPAPVPLPVPVPVPEPAPAPEPQLPPAATVTPIAPQRWNVWDLERIAREGAGADPIADEERTFILLYLRDFAGPDGLLPADFDELVRQSFGALVNG